MSTPNKPAEYELFQERVGSVIGKGRRDLLDLQDLKGTELRTVLEDMQIEPSVLEGMPDDATVKVRNSRYFVPSSKEGGESRYFDGIEIRWGELEKRQGATGTTLKIVKDKDGGSWEAESTPSAWMTVEETGSNNYFAHRLPKDTLIWYPTDASDITPIRAPFLL